MFQFPVFTISTGMILGLAARAIPALGIHEHPREERLVLITEVRLAMVDTC
jgi:hypothetical protein